MTVRGASSLFMLLILVLASCTKNPQLRTSEALGGDTVTKVQELRDSVSRSVSQGAAQRGVSSSGTSSPEKGSMRVDTLVGAVYVSGNEPFTRLTLALNDGRSSIYIEADTTLSKQLRKLQGRVVRIFGSVVRNGTGDFVRVNEFAVVQ